MLSFKQQSNFHIFENPYFPFPVNTSTKNNNKCYSCITNREKAQNKQKTNKPKTKIKRKKKKHYKKKKQKYNKLFCTLSR